MRPTYALFDIVKSSAKLPTTQIDMADLSITISVNLENPYVKLMPTRLLTRRLKFIYRYNQSDHTYIYNKVLP